MNDSSAGNPAPSSPMQAATQSTLPLSGVRVIDFSRVLAGPMCGMILGDLGADVIKIEHPERGDDTRDWGIRVGRTETAYFNSMNRNKRSVALDLQSAEGLAQARELVRGADVLIQNFKHGGMDRLGLGYDALASEQPGLVYCSVSGYDTSGPEATRPGYDLVVQGEAGLMAMNGIKDQPPLKFGIAIVDLMTGMYSAQAILAALFDRARNSGRGRHIQMALFDCGLMVTAYYGLEALLIGGDPPKFGNAHPSIVPYGVFDAADGPLVITVGNNAQFRKFCEQVIARPELADDPRYATNLARSANRLGLLPIIEAELAKRGRADLLAKLSAAGIPCGEVLGLHDALSSERARRGSLVHEYAHPDAGEAQVLAPPWRLDGQRPPVRRPPPRLGEHTQEVLDELARARHRASED